MMRDQLQTLLDLLGYPKTRTVITAARALCLEGCYTWVPCGCMVALPHVFFKG
jgi:hypothetical protein